MAYCDHCDRYFGSEDALYRHKQDSPRHYFCCGRDFPSYASRKQHWIQSPAHDYCQYCDEHFDDDDDELEDHFKQCHYYCTDCRRVFKSDYGLKQHYTQSDQHPYYCPSCDRHFQNENNLRNHLRSSIHRSKDIRCPFACGMSFIDRSDLVLHLEAGSCSSGLDRKSVNRFVRQYDRFNVITDPSRLITSGDEDITYIATRASWNGRSFECYLCHNVFSTLKSLNQHLASPAHEDKIYVCRGRSCLARFSTLSALCKHIESEKCDVQKFRAVQDAMNSLFGGIQRLTL